MNQKRTLMIMSVPWLLLTFPYLGANGVYLSFLVGAGTRMVAPLVVELGDYEIENDPKMLKEDSKTKEDLKMLEKDPKEEGKVG